MRNAWKEDQHPSFIDFISNFLSANSFHLNFVPIAPVIAFFFLRFLPCSFLFFSNTGSSLKMLRSFLVGLYFQLWGFVCSLHFCDKLGLQQCGSNLQQVTLGCCFGVICLGLCLSSYTEQRVYVWFKFSHAEFRNWRLSFHVFMLLSHSQQKRILIHLLSHISSEFRYLFWFD